jgi:hypothetical protein
LEVGHGADNLILEKMIVLRSPVRGSQGQTYRNLVVKNKKKKKKKRKEKKKENKFLHLRILYLSPSPKVTYSQH